MRVSTLFDLFILDQRMDRESLIELRVLNLKDRLRAGYQDRDGKGKERMADRTKRIHNFHNPWGKFEFDGDEISTVALDEFHFHRRFCFYLETNFRKTILREIRRVSLIMMFAISLKTKKRRQAHTRGWIHPKEVKNLKRSWKHMNMYMYMKLIWCTKVLK